MTRTTIPVTVDVPDTVLDEARCRYHAADNTAERDLDDFVLDHIEIRLRY